MAPKMEKDELIKEIVLELFYSKKGNLDAINSAIDAKFFGVGERSITLFEKYIRARIGTNPKVMKISKMEITPVEAVYLSNYPDLKDLEVLDIRQNFIGDVGLSAIAQSQYMTQLRELDVRNNQISRIGAIALYESPILENLETVDLRMNKLGKRWESKLKEGDHLPRLHTVKSG
ncbi:MAG: hypothetical protein COV66_15005 [Nitrospinae bacterium CG11_big_fil_rev_8_21_14_0_20_45_15]|nr:MAG: hypothetical protein COV66_15005 [Nitrospinae bacterium CG11_big_fil_rev_8_21_14_0_20_45_15]